MDRSHIRIPFVHVLSYNALAIFVMCDITYAHLSEFAPNYDHLAHTDDLHLHSFSFPLARSLCLSLTVTTMFSEVLNYLLSLLHLIHATLTKHTIHLKGFKYIELKRGLLIYPGPQRCPGTGTIEVKDTEWILLSCALSLAITII